MVNWMLKKFSFQERSNSCNSVRDFQNFSARNTYYQIRQILKMFAKQAKQLL